MILVSCFILVKVLVGKLLFKPKKVLMLMGLKRTSNYDNFKENMVVLGYTVIMALSEFLYEIFETKFAITIKRRDD